MRHIGLFEGIGGFSLAARWMGWHTIAWCEINPFGQKVLRHHFPNATGHENIITTDFTVYAGQCDILTGGFPCQPFSAAGKRRGTADDRHLWPEMLRVIREVSPRYIVGENVLGLVNWNGGLVFDQVCADLEAEGYQVAPVVIPAAAVNAPHGRDRIWFVAYRDCEGRKEWNDYRQPKNATQDEARMDNRAERYGNDAPTPDPDSTSSQCRHQQATQRRQNKRGRTQSFSKYSRWEEFPTQPPVCGGDDRLPRQLDGITFPKWRAESIKAYGNAIVPQVAFELFKVIEAMES